MVQFIFLMARTVAEFLVPRKLNVNVNIECTEIDSEGRILAINCHIENNPVAIICIYAPTKDNLTLQMSFLSKLKEIVEKHSDKPLIIGGDFNTCLNPDLDKKGGTLEQISSYHSSLLNFIDEFSLVDIWRIRNKSKSQFSWRGKGKTGLVQSRLDFFLVSLSVGSDILNTAITPSIGMDHSIISLTLSISQTQPRGKGTWKFNNSLLKDKNYVNMVKKNIQETQVGTSFTNNCLLQEFIKCKVRSETMVYSSHKAKLGRKREVELLYRLEKLESQLK